MTELIRDTAFGHLLRFVTNKRVLQWEEEKDPSLWKRYVHLDKTANMAQTGTVEAPEAQKDESEKETLDNEKTDSPLPGDESSVSSKPTAGNGVDVNRTTGQVVDPEKGRNVDIIEWWGPDDPENPQNWSHFKKFFVTFQICLLTFGIYIGSAIYTAGIMTVMQDFGVSKVAATLGLTLFVVGYGIGPMFWSPLSEVPQIGRNPIYIGTLLAFVLLQLPTGYAVNFGMLLAFRFITGFVGSPCLATGGASLGDMYRPQKRAYAISIWGISAVCGPVMGPLVGGWAAMFKGWQWTIWELTWLSGFAFIVLFFFLPETSANNILYRRTKRLRIVTGNPNLRCEPELMGESMTASDIVQMTLVRPITLNFTEPMVFLLNLYIALIYGLLYIWFESFPIVFVEIYGFNLGEEGLAFLGILIGAFIVIPPFFAYLYYVQEPKFNDRGELKPEERLPPACAGGIAVVICLFWFGWTARPDIHWIVPIIGSGWFSVGAFLLFNSVLNYLPDAYPEYAASVLAGNDFMRSSFGAGFPLFAGAMYNNLGVGWASSLLGFLAVAFVPIPFILYRYGETIRVKYSKHARKDF